MSDGNMSKLKKILFQKFLRADLGLLRLYFKSVYYNSLPKPFCYLREWPRKKIVKKFGCYISPKAKISREVYFPHPIGLVIGDYVEIGDNSIIYQHVTIGAARRGEGTKSLYPKIGRSVIIYAGSVVVGNINVGNNVVIGANSVVIKDVPDNAIVVGAPAKVVGKNADL